MINKRYTVAFMLTTTTSPYFKEIFLGIRDQLKKNNINLVGFVGGPLNAPIHTRSRNILYKQINQNNIDGLIIPSSSISRFLTPEKFKEYLDKFKNIPFVTIGNPIKNHPCIKTNYYKGMCLILEHIIKKRYYSARNFGLEHMAS